MGQCGPILAPSRLCHRPSLINVNYESGFAVGYDAEQPVVEVTT